MAEAKKPVSAPPVPALFKDSFFVGEKGTRRKALIFPIALALHIVLIVTAIVLPLLSTGALPTVEVYSAFLAPPPPPPPPPPP
ncbi:MAG: TonB family protein, partial [Candidatus Aminicenantales bacterium]